METSIYPSISLCLPCVRNVMRSDVTWRLARLSRTDLPGVRQSSVAKMSAALDSWLGFELDEEMENWNMRPMKIHNDTSIVYKNI